MSFCKRNPDLNYLVSKTTTTMPPHPSSLHHYDWGASGAKTWRGCPSSINLVRKLREDGEIPMSETSEAAETGSEAHGYADGVLKGELDECAVPLPFWEHLQGYVEFAQELTAEAGEGALTFYEQQVNYWYEPEETGTLDYAVVELENGGAVRKISNLDLKYGIGVEVDVKENDQGIIYVRSLCDKLEALGHPVAHDTPIDIYIYQPRHWTFDDLPKKWSTTRGEIEDYAIDIEADYKHSVESGLTDLRPSESACTFCPAGDHGRCPAKNEKLFNFFPDESNLFTPNQEEVFMHDYNLTPEIRLKAFVHRKEIVKWLEDINNDTLRLIEDGTLDVDGLKVVKGRSGNRAWTDARAVEKFLSRHIPVDLRYKPRKLISPTAAKKILKGADTSTRFTNKFETFVHQSEGGPCLAVADDSRDPLVSTKDRFVDETVVTAPNMEDLI